LGFNLNETSHITGFSARTIRRFVQRGLLHPVKASRRLIFTKAEIERFLEDSTAR
jgi:DNA-binding transcriptional MerR regulator